MRREIRELGYKIAPIMCGTTKWAKIFTEQIAVNSERVNKNESPGSGWGVYNK